MRPNHVKSFCTGRETINKTKRQPIGWEKIFANDETKKGLMSKIYKQQYQKTQYQKTKPFNKKWSSVQFSCSVVSTLCDPVNHSTPGLPFHHQLLEFTQTHVRRVGDAIQPSHPLLSLSPPSPNPSQHQSLFQ